MLGLLLLLGCPPVAGTSSRRPAWQTQISEATRQGANVEDGGSTSKEAEGSSSRHALRWQRQTTARHTSAPLRAAGWRLPVDEHAEAFSRDAITHYNCDAWKCVLTQQ